MVVRKTSSGGRNGSRMPCASVSFLHGIFSRPCWCKIPSITSVSCAMIGVVASIGRNALVSSCTRIVDFTASFPAFVLVRFLMQTICFHSCSTKIFTRPLSACVDSIVREFDL